MNHEFPVSRKIIASLDGWMNALASPFLPLVFTPDSVDAFHWEFSEKNPRTLLIGKAVRMVSGIKASLILADSGYRTECASLLRMVSESSKEILSVGEGIVEDRLTEAQQRFVRQYFAPLAKNPAEYEDAEKERYVSREELYKAHYRLLAHTAEDAARMRLVSRFLDYTYDKYVHGAYLTAMELYDIRKNCFVLNGFESDEQKGVGLTAVAGKLHEVVSALEMVSVISGNQVLKDEVGAARRALDASGEY